MLLMTLALILVSVPAFAEEPVEVEFFGTEDWINASIKVDNTRPWEIQFDIDFESITKYVLADRWADTIEVLVRNNEVEQHFEFEVQAYCNNDTKYQIACSAKVVSKGAQISDRPFNWSANYEAPVTKVHATLAYDGETFSWLVVNREDEAVMDEFTFNAAEIPEGLKAGTNCDLGFYRDPKYLVPDNFTFAYTDAQTVE